MPKSLNTQLFGLRLLLGLGQIAPDVMAVVLIIAGFASLTYQRPFIENVFAHVATWKTGSKNNSFYFLIECPVTTEGRTNSGFYSLEWPTHW